MIAREARRASATESSAERRLRPVWVGAAAFVVTLLVLALNNKFVFTQHAVEDGDFAVNSILIDRAKHFQLLVGNYSRVGFNHPGPGLLYVQAWGELLFRDAVPLTRSPFGGQMLGILVLNSALLGVSAAIVSAHTRTLVAPIALIGLALAYGQHVPGLLTSTWMPNVYVWPFLLLVVSAASIVAGRHDHLWALALASGFLVHGHVSFVLFVSVVALVVAAVLFVRRRRSGSWEVPRWSAVSSAVILGLFALPMLLELLLHYPGQIDDYVRYSRSDDTGGHRTKDVLAFVKDYWNDSRMQFGLIVLFVVVLCLVAWRWTSGPARRMTAALLAMVTVASACMLFYAARGVDDLSFTYVGRFYYAAPLVTVLCVALVLPELPGLRRWHGALAVAAAVWVGWLALTSAQANPYRGAPAVPAAAAAAAGEADSVALTFGLEAWPQAAGIVEQLRRDGSDVCVDGSPDDTYEVLFSKGVICSQDELSRWALVHVQAPNAVSEEPIIFESSYVVLTAPDR